MPDDSDRFLDLVIRYFDGELEDGELAELNRRLRASPECREELATYCTRSQMIRELDQPERLAELRPEQDAAGVIAHLRLAGEPVGRRGWTRRVASLAAAVLLVGGALWLTSLLWQGPDAIATLVEAVDVKWRRGAEALQRGAPVGSGVLRLDAGVVKLRYPTGTSVTVEGPAAFEIVDDDVARLHSGILTARVPSDVSGFKIDTPAVRVVDPATAFGITVDAAGTTDVCVFEGEVEIEMSDRSSNRRTRRRKRVQHGLAVRAAAGDERVAETAFDARPFSRAWPVNAGVLRTSGMVRFAPPGPPQTLIEYEDDEHLVLLPERRGFRLKRKTKVNITRPGEYEGRGMSRVERLPRGTRVRSFLVQFNPVGDGSRREVRRLVGIATFERPIVGIITDTRLLQASDQALGGHRDRFASPGRGLERGRGKNKDKVTLSDDRRTLVLDLRVTGPRLDQIRVLVDASRS